MAKIFEKLKRFYNLNFLWGSIVVLGVFLRLRQYFVNRSLWVDEASLALNIINRTFSDLMLPLDYDQGAPLGFLFIQKIFVSILGNQEYVLRLFPLISGIVATFLFCLIAKQILGKFGILATLLFSISSAMVYYSSEVKQYSSDVMITLLLTYLAIQCLKEESQLRDIVLLTVTGVISIFVSHPSVFVLAVIGILLLINKYLNKLYSHTVWLLGAGVSWAIAFLVVYMLSLKQLIGNENLQNYWNNYYSPLPPWEHIGWYRNAMLSLLPNITPSFFATTFPGFPEGYVINSYLILVLIGGFYFFLRNTKLTFLFVFPIGLALVASALQRYPIYDRFIYFWLPALILLITNGVRQIYVLCMRFNIKVAIFIYSLLSFFILWTPTVTAYHNLLNPPLGEHIKPVFTYIEENIQEDDIIYVHHGSITPFLYYSPLYAYDKNEVFLAKKSNNFKRFTIDVVNFQGADRVWFVFSHVIYCDCDGSSTAERIQAHINVLDEYGFQLASFEAEKASTYLYDLNP